jgi:hypothetical protein
MGSPSRQAVEELRSPGKSNPLDGGSGRFSIVSDCLSGVTDMLLILGRID